MNTPICDFLKKYSESGVLRLHMPGHKGTENSFDITEVSGADSLYEAGGIIRESEQNASALFGCDTFYSTEGSSHCIRAMLWLCVQKAKAEGKKAVILAGRNAHRAFISAAALCDCAVEWIYPENGGYLSCDISAKELEERLKSFSEKPVALYVTSPDYLGNTLDIKALSEVCRRYGVLLLVDNAHGAYLRFLEKSLHPVDLGADMCCDSAHKTLPVLTGGAYLHILPSAPKEFKQNAKSALSLFGSTSPSYLIMSSLDRANAYLKNGYKKRLAEFIAKVDELKQKLTQSGYELLGTEPLKITLLTSKYGYSGLDFAEILRNNGIECEFADKNAVVLMLTEQITESEIARLEIVLLSVEKREPINTQFPEILPLTAKYTPREAALLPFERVKTEDAVGRVAAFSVAACPPAVDIVVPGEEITPAAAKAMQYCGIEYCSVIK